MQHPIQPTVDSLPRGEIIPPIGAQLQEEAIPQPDTVLDSEAALRFEATSDPEAASQTDLLPPTYEASFIRLNLKATSIPRWDWTNTECRAWITAFCITFLGKSLEHAEELAQRYTGCGTMIYTTEAEYWHGCLEGLHEGTSIYNYLQHVVNDPESVPDGVRMFIDEVKARRFALLDVDKPTRLEGKKSWWKFWS